MKAYDSRECNEKLFCFRADANSTIGSGHIMRCLSIAVQLTQLGHKCVFITADHNADRLLNGSGMKTICLDTAWNRLDEELGALLDYIRETSPAMLIVDHYYVTEQYLRVLRRNVKLVYMDDVKSFAYPCDALVNYNIFSSLWSGDYSRLYAGEKNELILGTEYVPLRDEFACIERRRINPEAKDILVSTGGADPCGIAEIIMRDICTEPAFSEILFHFVVGALNPNLAALERIAEGHENIRLHIGVRRMSELMLSCDMAIAAAGSTLYELCACGTPTTTYVLAENQIPAAEEFSRLGLMINVGDARTNGFTDALKSAVLGLYNDMPGRIEMSKCMQEQVDGLGAKRLAERLSALMI